MKFRMGKNAKMYFSATPLADAVGSNVATGLTAAAVCTGISDVTVSLGKDKSETTTRANTGFKAYQGALKDLTISFKIQVESAADAAFQAALEDSYLNDTEVAVYALNGPKTEAAAKGPAGNMICFKYDRDETLADKITYDIELQPGGTEVVAWAHGSGS